MENWRPVLGYEGHYEASDFGRLRRVSSAPGTHAGKINRPGYCRGYALYTLCVECKSKSFRAHRLIWQAFNGPIPDGLHINHKNGDKADNRLANLEVCTPQQNYRHALDVLGHKPSQPPGTHVGSKNTNAVITDGDVAIIRRRYAEGGISQQALADQFGIHQAHVSRIIRKTSWPHL